MSQKDIQQRIDETIVIYQDSLGKYFEKNQKIQFPHQEVPFRFRNSNEYVMNIECHEYKESIILMRVTYLKEVKTRFFKSQITLNDKRKRSVVLILNKWSEVSEYEYKNLVLVKKNK